MRVTFVVRQREISDSTALPIAAGYDADYLRRRGHSAQVLSMPVEKVPAYNFSNLAMTSDLVIVEGASWVPVVKIQGLLEQGVTVLVRVHAAPEFLYAESPHAPAASYIKHAARAGCLLGFVSADLTHAYQDMLPGVVHPLSIVYPAAPPPAPVDLRTLEHINVGAFGAVRVLKNHIAQLLALGKAKEQWFKQHSFSYHINSDRCEDLAARDIVSTLENVSEMYGIQLVKHAWSPCEHFRASVIPKMNMGMFVSLAESFCLTAADFVAQGVPVVLGNHVPWSFAGCGSTVPEIAEAVKLCILEPTQMQEDWASLTMASVEAKEHWDSVLTKVKSHVLAN